MSDLPSATTNIATQKQGAAWAGLFHLLVIYIVWGSTYLAIRIAVMEGAGFPPFSLGATRLLAAGSLLLIGVYLARLPLKLSREEFGVLLLSGFLLWVGGNGLVMWAEQHADSGYAALLVASTPIWVAVFEAVLDRRIPPALLVVSLMIGFAGIGLLTAPAFFSDSRLEPLAILALIIAPISWGMGLVLQKRKPVSLNPFVSSGYQQFFAGLMFTAISLALHEPLPNPTPEAWWAWGYLVVAGSLLAFTSFLMAIRLLPASIVTTYAYVNPVVAVILGWLVLQETIGLWTIAGMFLVLLGVAGVFNSQHSFKRSNVKG